MDSTTNKRMRVMVLLAWTTLCLCSCPDGQYTCPDTIRGITCYDGAVTSCVLDSSLGFYRLCGAGLSSCGGVCYKPGSSSCDGKVLIKPTAKETSTQSPDEIREPQDTSSADASPDKSSSEGVQPQPTASASDQQPAADTSPVVPSTTSSGGGVDKENSTAPSNTGTYTPYKAKTRQPVNTNAPVPAPNPGPGGAPPQHSPFAAQSTNSVQNTTTDSVQNTIIGSVQDTTADSGGETTSTATTTLITAGGFDNDNDTVSSTTSSTVYTPYKAKTRQPVDTNFSVPPPNPGPGGAPPQQPFKRTGDVGEFPSASFDPMASRRRSFDR